MKNFTRCFALACGLAWMSGCSSWNPTQQNGQKETPGQQVGRAAYDAQKDVKKGAKEITQDLKDFRRDAREGYQEEKQKHEQKKKAEPVPPAPTQ